MWRSSGCFWEWWYRLGDALIVGVCLYGAFCGPLLGQPINPDIRVNNVTGINGQASGAPGAVAAIFLPLGCATIGASTTIQAPLHGMAATIPTDGSAALWLNTASGRRWTKITAFPTANTITVADSFNIAVAVNCAAGGKIAGTLANVTLLCGSMKDGWTITVENTGTGYSDSGTCGLGGAGGNIVTDGRFVLTGDDPTNPPTITVTSNATYINEATPDNYKVENLNIVRNVAGTTGVGVFAAQGGGVVRNVNVSTTLGTWQQPQQDTSRPGMFLESLLVGPWGVSCMNPGDDSVVVANTYRGCSGSVSAFLSPSAQIMFNIVDQGAVNLSVFSSSVNNGAGGIRMFNTLLAVGSSGIAPGANGTSIYSGNLISEASTLSGACFAAGANANALLGSVGFGQPSVLWLGNAANACPTARYTGGLESSSQGAATDIAAGVAVDPLFRDAASLDFFPLSALVKSDTVFPGVAYTFQTPAAPVSTNTAGASQRPGSGGASNYAYSGP
jgi:hypothetical protein